MTPVSAEPPREPTLLSRFAAAEIVRRNEEAVAKDELLQRVVADYDRRRAHWWGRALLWLLRHTT